MPIRSAKNHPIGIEHHIPFTLMKGIEELLIYYYVNVKKSTTTKIEINFFVLFYNYEFNPI